MVPAGAAGGVRGGVLHVLPYDLARGAQRYARALVDILRAGPERHLILTLFASQPVLLEPDVELGVPLGWGRRLGLDLRAVMRLRRAIRRIGPRVVIAHGGEPAKYAALAVPRHVTLVYYKIGTVDPRLASGPRRRLHGFSSRRADLIAAVSRDVAEEASRLLGIPESKLVVIPNGRDPEVFRPRPETDHEGRPRLVFVGHLDAGKRPDWFIEVVASVRARGSDVEAIVIGDGPLAESLRPASAAAGVTMLGRRDDVPQLLATGDVFVFTSSAPGEGMPGVLIEAGLSGLPVVATAVPGARDVVEQGVTGLLVDLEDRAGLTEAVYRLVADRELRSSMGHRARERCLRQFTLEASARRWEELLRAMPESQGRPSP